MELPVLVPGYSRHATIAQVAALPLETGHGWGPGAVRDDSAASAAAAECHQTRRRREASALPTGSASAQGSGMLWRGGAVGLAAPTWCCFLDWGGCPACRPTTR